jgi:hypothetical protein
LFKKLLVALVLLFSLFSANAVTEHPDGTESDRAKELVQLQDEVNLVIQQVYKSGVKDGSEAVKSNPKLCPKDV